MELFDSQQRIWPYGDYQLALADLHFLFLELLANILFSQQHGIEPHRRSKDAFGWLQHCPYLDYCAILHSQQHRGEPCRDV